MSAKMMDYEMNALFEPGQNGMLAQVKQLQQELAAHRFESYCLHLKNQLSRIQDLNSELPKCLEYLKWQQPVEHIPECAVVLCYPFTQECFIYHAVEEGLGASAIARIQQILLPLSSHSDIQSWAETVYIGQHVADLMLVGQDFMVWRLYLNINDSHQAYQPLLRQLDECIQQGFQERDQQKRYIQDVLQLERKAFSADLHDSIAQILGFLRLKSAQLCQQCKQGKYPEFSEQVEEISSYTHYAYQQVRELITASRLAYQELDFIVALKKVIQEFEQQSSIVFELDHRVHHVSILPRQSVQVLYIVRESLSNIVRHAHASYAKVLLEIRAGHLYMTISDNGQGICPELKRKDSFGLEIMQERAERIGAVLRIYPLQPHGTCVDLKLQLASED